MTEPWSIENNDAILLRGLLDEAAGNEILHHAAISMQQDERFALTRLPIVQAQTSHLDKAPRWVPPFRAITEVVVDGR
jgi:hypothetical protein